MQTPDVTKGQITGIVTPLITALVTFGAFNNEKAATITTAVVGVISFTLLLADAVIRIGRSRMHGHQLAIYALGKVESLVAQGVNVNAVLGGNTRDGAAPTQAAPAPGRPSAAAGDVDAPGASDLGPPPDGPAVEVQTGSDAETAAGVPSAEVMPDVPAESAPPPPAA